MYYVYTHETSTAKFLYSYTKLVVQELILVFAIQNDRKLIWTNGSSLGQANFWSVLLKLIYWVKTNATKRKSLVVVGRLSYK